MKNTPNKRGKSIADIVLLKENPLENIEAVGKVATVVRGGMLVHETEMRK